MAESSPASTAAEPEGQKQTGIGRFLLTRGSAMVLINAASAILVLVVNIVLVRVLGDSMYGIYAFVMAYVGLLTIPVTGCAQQTPKRVETDTPDRQVPTVDSVLDKQSDLRNIVAVSPSVDNINLHTSPSAMNWDNQPGTDGIEARIYFFRVDTSQAISLNAGTLEFVMYPGRVPAEQLSEATPIRTWRFTARDMQRRRNKTVIGWAHQFRLSFDDQRPNASAVTVTARLMRPNGKLLYAMPVQLATGDKR